MKREQHVNHLLIRYATGQLNSQQISRVRSHLAVCKDCQFVLKQHEDLAIELRQAALSAPALVPEHIGSWWEAICTRQAAENRHQRRYVLVSLVAPIMLSLLLLAGVLATEAGSARAAVSATIGEPILDTTLEPTSRANSHGLPTSLQPETTATPDARGKVVTIPTAPSPAETE